MIQVARATGARSSEAVGAAGRTSPARSRRRGRPRRSRCSPRACRRRAAGAGRAEREPLFVPIGIGDETLEPAGFELYEGDHALIAGPPRSGRTTSLLVVAEVVARLYPDIQLQRRGHAPLGAARVPRRSPGS